MDLVVVEARGGARVIQVGVVVLALAADGSRISGGVFLDGEAVFDGKVRLLGATIGGQLSCRGGHFRGADASEASPSIALDLQRIKAGAIELPTAGRVDARAAQIDGDLSGWTSNVYLDTTGLSYRTIDHGASSHWKDHVEALSTQQDGDLDPGGFDQLAASYKASGHANVARSVLYAKELALTQRGGYGNLRIAWRQVLRAVTGHGLRPAWTVMWAVAIVLIGSAFTLAVPPDDWAAPTSHGITQQAPSSMRSHPVMAVAYTADVFLPIVDLGSQDQRQPKPGHWAPWILDTTLILLGWALTTIIVTAFTAGVIRRID